MLGLASVLSFRSNDYHVIVLERMTLNGALAGMVIGAVTVIVWKNVFASTGIYEIIPGFIFALISIVVVSLLGKAPNATVTGRFEQADEIYTREMK